MALLYVTTLFGNPLVTITSDKTKLYNFELSYFIDRSKKMSISDVGSMKFVDAPNRDTLGVDVTNTWIKIALYNATAKKQELFLHEDLGFTFVKTVYYEVDTKHSVLNKKVIDYTRDSYPDDIEGSDAVYKFELNPHEYKTIYVNQVTNAYHFYNFLLFNEKNSLKYLIYEKIDGVLFAGLLFALALYNFLLFLSTRYKEYLYYTLYLSSATLWIFYMYGAMAHYVQIYGEIAFRFNFALMFIPIFLALFVQTVFETKTRYKREHLFLNTIIVSLLLTVIYGIFNFNHALQLLSLVLDYSLLVFMGISISIYRKGDPLIKIFLLAHTFYLIYNIYALLFYMGLVDFNYVSSHAIGIGIIVEALFLSYLLSYRIKILEEMKKSQAELKRLSVTDPLTALHNRRYFDTAAEHLLKISRRMKQNLSVIMMDIDSFKHVNDTYGHTVGDDVLVKLALKLKEISRESDVVCRFGGEEFIILLPVTDIEGAMTLAEKIREECSLLRILSDKDELFSFTLSLGVSQVDYNHDEDIKIAINKADKALYNAKNSGKNQVCSS
jgi:diguanylate cyclase (GGDEF)-like protein